MQKVSLLKSKNYDAASLKRDVVRLLEPLGGISAFVAVGDRVLLKPNLLAAKNPQQAVTTHPELVRVVAELVRDAGGIALIGDSPGIGSLQRVAQKCGITAASRASGAQLVEFKDSVELPAVGLFRRIRLAQAYLDADKVINLPKLKTHEMMTMTCAVKNLFGRLSGQKRPPGISRPEPHGSCLRACCWRSTC